MTSMQCLVIQASLNRFFMALSFDQTCLAKSLLIFSIICFSFDASISSLHCSFILVIVSLNTSFYSNAHTYWSNVIIINDSEKSIRGFSIETLYNLLDGALNKVTN